MTTQHVTPTPVAISPLRHRAVRKLAVALTLLLAGLAGGSAAQAAGPGASVANLSSPGANTRLFGDAVQSDGRVVAVGESGVTAGADILVARYTKSGALDGSFGSGGVVHGPGMSGGNGSVARSVAIQSDGKIVVVGKISGSNSKGTDGMLVERYNANGSLDHGFGSGGVVTLFAGNNEFGDGYGVAIQPDGKIVASGSANTAGQGGTAPRVAVARLNANGSLDSSFGSGGQAIIDDGAYSYAYAVTLQSDGKIVFAGSQSPNLQVVNALIGRLTASGHPDSSFNGSGAYAHQFAKNGASSAFNAVVVQPGGKLVAAGAAPDGNTSADALLVRFNSNGSVDGSFGSGGVVYTPSAQNLLLLPSTVPGAYGLVVAANGNLVTSGMAANGIQVNSVLHAYTPNGGVLASFGSGGSVSASAASGNSEDAGLAIASDGTLAAVGDTSSMASTGYAGAGGLFGGVGAPAGGAAFKVTLSGLSKSYKINTVSKHGVPAKVACNQGCTLRVKLVAGAATAKQLGLGGKGKCTTRHGKRTCKATAVTVGSASGKLSGAGSKRFVVKLSASARRAIGKQKHVKLTLQATGISTSSHKSKSASRTLTLKR